MMLALRHRDVHGANGAPLYRSRMVGHTRHALHHRRRRAGLRFGAKGAFPPKDFFARVRRGRSSGSRMMTVWPQRAATTPEAISNRSGFSGFPLDTRHLPRSVIMEAEKFAWFHHAGKTEGTYDRRTVARDCNGAITNSCINPD